MQITPPDSAQLRASPYGGGLTVESGGVFSVELITWLRDVTGAGAEPHVQPHLAAMGNEVEWALSACQAQCDRVCCPPGLGTVIGDRSAL